MYRIYLDDVRTPTGDNWIVVRNYDEFVNKVNYFFYDKRNQLFVEKYSKYDLVNYWTVYDGFKVSNYFPHSQNHGLSVLINLFRSVKIAKELVGLNLEISKQ